MLGRSGRKVDQDLSSKSTAQRTEISKVFDKNTMVSFGIAKNSLPSLKFWIFQFDFLHHFIKT